MVSRFVLADGAVHYRNRYVRTRHYCGRGGTTHIGTPSSGGRLNRILHPVPSNLANTNVIQHAGRMYALWEGGLPHELDPDTLETVGARRFGGRLRWMGSYSAHPCFCPDIGEMYNFGVELFPGPHLRIYATNPRGRLRHLTSVRLPYPAMIHDFALTERHLVFLVSPIVPAVLPIVTGSAALGEVMEYRPEKGSAVIVVDRDGRGVRTIETDPFLQFHLSNAFDRGGDVVVDAITYRDGAVLNAIADFRTRSLTDAPSALTRFTVGKSGAIGRELISATSCEFPRHHPGFDGKEHRYAYIATRNRLATLYDAITKVDLHTRDERTYAAETPGNSFCEPVFAPRPGADAEDDGWLLTVEYQSDSHRSRLVVLDARDVEAGPVFRAQLTHHIPQGFHGNFYPV
jgi:all-trans-8'-apo-beta-carotenal 15,15'-oxygenase